MKICKKKQEHGSTHPRPSISPFTVHHRCCLSGAAATDHHHTASFSLMPAPLSLLTGGASPPPSFRRCARLPSHHPQPLVVVHDQREDVEELLVSLVEELAEAALRVSMAPKLPKEFYYA